MQWWKSNVFYHFLRWLAELLLEMIVYSLNVYEICSLYHKDVEWKWFSLFLNGYSETWPWFKSNGIVNNCFFI